MRGGKNPLEVELTSNMALPFGAEPSALMDTVPPTPSVPPKEVFPEKVLFPAAVWVVVKSAKFWVAEPVPPLATGSVPVTPEVKMMAAPSPAAVIRPCASTIMVARVYDPAVTAVLASERVPVVVTGPPVRPVPVATLVTEPLPLPVPTKVQTDPV